MKITTHIQSRRTILKSLPAVAVGIASVSRSEAYFAPPPTIEANVFTRLPDKFRKMRRNTWTELNRGGREAHSFLEGPAFDRQGRLYVTDVPFGRIFRISAQGEWEQVAEYDGWPNGLKIHKDGRIFIACYKRGLMLLNPDSGAVTPFLEGAGSESFKGLNDLIFAANGNLYFTDQGETGLQDATGRVYRLSASGVLTMLINSVPSPNGIVIDTGMNNLFIAATRAQQIWRIPLQASGRVAKVGVFAQLHGGLGGPDGIALDEDGCLIVCHTSFGSIWRLSPVAEPLLRIPSKEGINTTTSLLAAQTGRAFSSPNPERAQFCGLKCLRPGSFFTRMLFDPLMTPDFLGAHRALGHTQEPSDVAVGGASRRQGLDGHASLRTEPAHPRLHTPKR